MKICFRIHPDDYDKAANEKFYEQMAEKGWIVTKRWANLSKFEKAEPQQLKFDIYYADYNYVSVEEEAEFKASSRTTVEVKSNVHVSYALKNLALPPVLKSSEDIAKALIPLKNRNTILTPIVSIFIVGLIRDIRPKTTYNAFVSLPFFEKRLFEIITMPELYILAFILLSYIIFTSVYERIRWKKAVDAFRNGTNPDNGIRKKLLYILNLCMIALTVGYIAFSTYGNMVKTEYEIPEISDGLYLDTHDLGIADKITSTGYRYNNEYIGNRIKRRSTLSAKILITEEYYTLSDTDVIVYQDIIEYKSQKAALFAAKLLSSNKDKIFNEIEFFGFEKVYDGPEELIAVLNNTVYRITCVTSDENLVPSDEQLLDAILKKQ